MGRNRQARKLALQAMTPETISPHRASERRIPVRNVSSSFPPYSTIRAPPELLTVVDDNLRNTHVRYATSHTACLSAFGPKWVHHLLAPWAFTLIWADDLACRNMVTVPSRRSTR